MLGSSGPFEVISNPLEDLLRFAWPELPNEPLLRGGPAFAIVAAIKAIAKRYDVLGNSTGTHGISQRYPMVLGQGMPQPTRTPAYGATIIEIFNRPIPIICTISHRQPAACGPAALRLSVCARRIVLAPRAVILSSLLAVDFIRIASIPIALVPFVLFPMRFGPLAGIFNHLFGMRLIPRPIALLEPLRIGLVSGAAFCATARTANRVKAVLGHLMTMEVFKSGKKIPTAFRALLERIGDIQHRNLLSLHLGSWGGPAPRKAVVERLITPFLAHFIIPHIERMNYVRI